MDGRPKHAFKISRLILHIKVDENYRKATYDHCFLLEKVSNIGDMNDSWTYCTDVLLSQIENIRVTIKENGTDRPIQARPIEVNGKAKYEIDFGVCYRVGDRVQLVVEFDKPINCVKVEKSLLNKRYLLFSENIVFNQCDRIENIFLFPKSKTRLIAKVPESYEFKENKNEHLFFKDRLAPGELFTVCALVEEGVLSQKTSKVLSWVLSAIFGGIVSMLVPLVVRAVH